MTAEEFAERLGGRRAGGPVGGEERTAARAVRTLTRAGTPVHGQKPQEFQQVIDRLYDGGPDQKLKLFGRRPVNGWTQFGNEITKAAS